MAGNKRCDQGLVLREECRAARIGEVTQFAECQAKPEAFCEYRLSFINYRYCVHPLREAIIARTLAEKGPPGE